MPIVLLAALLFGAALGSQLPDIDLWLFFLVGQHRSGLTHSPLIPFLVWVAVRDREPWWNWFGAGLAAAFAAHFARDLFPAAWYGFAQIHLPIWGRLGGTLSVVWLLSSIVACWYLALRFIAHRHLVPMVALAAAVGFAFELARGRWPMPVFWPVVVLLATFALATMLPNPVIDGRVVARRWWAAASRSA